MKDNTVTMMRLRSLDPETLTVTVKTQKIDDWKVLDGDLYIIMPDDGGRICEHIIAAGTWVECVTWEEKA